MSGDDYLVVGEITRAHGIKGECFIRPTTDDVTGVYSKGRELLLGDAAGQPLGSDTSVTVQAARPFKGGLIVKFADIRDRNTAEALRGRTLVIRLREARALEADEFFLHDLVGLEVYTESGERVGRVTEIYEAAAGHLLAVDDGERERLIPFSRQVVREVDTEGGRIVIEPTPGLLEI